MDMIKEILIIIGFLTVYGWIMKFLISKLKKFIK